MSTKSDPESPPMASDMQTDYVVGQDNIEGSFGPIGFDIHNRVFAVSALASVVFIILTLLFPERAGSIFQSIVAFSTGTLDWYFMILVDFFILFCLALVVLPYGSVRLGGLTLARIIAIFLGLQCCSLLALASAYCFLAF